MKLEIDIPESCADCRYSFKGTITNLGGTRDICLCKLSLFDRNDGYARKLDACVLDAILKIEKEINERSNNQSI